MIRFILMLGWLLPVVNSPAVGKPGITGAVRVGEVLTVDVSGIADSDGVPSLFSYQWVRVDGGDEVDISGATGSTYQLVSVDVGKKLKVEVSFVDDGGFSEGPLASDATALVPAPVNNPPVFTSSSSFFVNENLLSVGVVVASDGDGLDGVSGYVVSGGVDSGRFSITNGGVLTFNSAPDFEVPVDVGGNNVYNVVVNVTSGTSGRVQTAIQTITVTVTDVVEVPSAPGRPVLGSPSSTSLLVGWSVPSNTGPAISGYDVEYRQGASGSFSGWPHSGTGTSATITGLSASTLYQVQVLARNDEGNSSWSPTASLTTGSTPPPPATNHPPVFTSSPTFSVSENTVSVGTVVASDSDGQDSVNSYMISSGVDRNSFSITNDGELTFISAPDFEVPVDSGGNNVYDLIVTATSGTGSRELSATQSVTVTVTDVVEVPSAPGRPVLGSPSSTSLSVSWSAPGNTGPSIIDYDVGYGLNSGGPFADWPHSDASRSATITGLNVSTLYYVRVRAGNAEGNSSWSETSSFTTMSVVTNSDPVFTSSPTFSVNENTVSVGTVVASDSDSQDSVIGYRISSGVDSARFSITNEGVLTFRSAPNYESPGDSDGDNVYNLVVTVPSGTGTRVRTATQSITVTVNDTVEGPVVPPVVLVYSCV